MPTQEDVVGGLVDQAELPRSSPEPDEMGGLTKEKRHDRITAIPAKAPRCSRREEWRLQ